jgi:hypothetical protein
MKPLAITAAVVGGIVVAAAAVVAAIKIPILIADRNERGLFKKNK